MGDRYAGRRRADGVRQYGTGVEIEGLGVLTNGLVAEPAIDSH
jgi:hypothetical protein